MGELVDPPYPPGPGWPYPHSIQTSTPNGTLTCEGPIITGIAMPGQWLLTKAVRVYGWQKQVSNFMSGGTVVPTGDPPMDIEYEVRIWDQMTMSAFIMLCKGILKKPASVVPGVSGGGAAALGIDDPILKIYGVTSVVVEHLDFPKNPLITSGGKGPWVGKVGFIEYRKAIPALPVPDQTIPDPGAVTPSAAANLATANASVTAGAASLQSQTAQRFVPPR